MPISYVPNPHAADDPSWVGAADRVALANFADREAFAERVALVSQRWAAATTCLLYTSPSPRDRTRYRMPSSA